MTFLELVNRTKQECGVPGEALTTIVGANREMQRIIDWVAQSYTEIQEEHQDWDFLRESMTFNTVAEQQTYTVGDGASYDIDLDDFGIWRNDSFRAYLQSAGIATQIILAQYYSYSEFRDFYLLGSRQLVSGRPLYITIEPASRSLLLGFKPNDIYVVTGEYYRTPHTLTVDADTPIFPSRYHLSIVYKAMQKYGLFNVAAEQIEAGRQGFSKLINRMEIDQLPQMLTGASLI